ncbi:MAG: hypothetical protein ACYCPO_07035 [Acidobacteriaceae bacterium]
MAKDEKGQRLEQEYNCPQPGKMYLELSDFKKADVQQNQRQQNQAVCQGEGEVPVLTETQREDRGPQRSASERSSQPADALEKGIGKTDDQKPDASTGKQNRANDQDDVSFHANHKGNYQQLGEDGSLCPQFSNVTPSVARFATGCE